MAQAKALTLASPAAFGIPGMTTGAVGIMTMMFFGMVTWWIKGMADRRRADNEGVTVASGANDALFKRMTEENERLVKMLDKYDAKFLAQDLKIAAQDRRISELERELADERRGRLGELKNAAQSDISSAAVLKKLDKEI